MASERSGGAVGLTVFASIMLLAIGMFQGLAGLSAILKDDSTLWIRGADLNYFVTFDTTQWGWVHLILGVIIFLAGLGVLSGNVLARTVGVIVALISLVINFLFIPIYPFWAIAIIVLDVLVIWALTAHGRDITTDA
jgi:hypothetical protein